MCGSRARSRGGRASRHLFDQPMPVGLVEPRLHGEQFVQRQAQRIDVAAGVGFPVELLRCHVAERAEDVAGVRQVLLVCRLGEAEVGHPHTAPSVEEQVGRLDVAVDDPLAVGILQARQPPAHRYGPHFPNKTLREATCVAEDCPGRANVPDKTAVSASFASVVSAATRLPLSTRRSGLTSGFGFCPSSADG